MLSALEREESNMDISLKCLPEMVCSFQTLFSFPELALFCLSISDKNHSLYCKKFYGLSQDLRIPVHCHYMDITETLAVTKKEHIEIVGKGDLDIFRLKLMTCISLCDKLDDIF